MRARWSVVLWVGLVALGIGSPRAVAQSAGAQAQSLFDEGRKLMKAGKTAEACAAFDSSHKLDPAVTTLLNLAECRETNHQLATAWGLFVEAKRMARTAGNDKLTRVATNHAQKLEPRLSKLTISVSADRQIAGLQVVRGDEPIDPAGWNHALPIDGGTYTITARAPGRTPWSITRTIKIERDAQTVEIPALAVAKPVPPAVARTTTPQGEPRPVASAPTAPVSPASAPAAPAEEPDAPAAAASRGSSKLVPIVVGGGALALGGVAIALHLSGNSTYDRAKALTDPKDQARRDSLYNSANNRRYAAEAFGVAAIGCAGVAIYLYVRGRGEHRADVALAPIASPQLAGLAVVGGW